MWYEVSEALTDNAFSRIVVFACKPRNRMQIELYVQGNRFGLINKFTDKVRNAVRLEFVHPVWCLLCIQVAVSGLI